MRWLLCAISAHAAINDGKRTLHASSRMINTFAGFVVTTTTNFSRFVVTNHLLNFLSNRSNFVVCLEIQKVLVINYTNMLVSLQFPKLNRRQIAETARIQLHSECTCAFTGHTDRLWKRIHG